MAYKPFALEARKSGPQLINCSTTYQLLHLLLSLKTKSSNGLEKAATADYVYSLRANFTIVQGEVTSNFHPRLMDWYRPKVLVASSELLLFCELRVNSEKCELVHLECELRVG